jgi:hypothetical protein
MCILGHFWFGHLLVVSMSVLALQIFWTFLLLYSDCGWHCHLFRTFLLLSDTYFIYCTLLLFICNFSSYIRQHVVIPSVYITGLAS